MTFSQIGLSSEILRAIAEEGYTDATPIQKQAIPAILQGKDILASAQTGTGKTAGFTLPLLQILTNTTQNRGHRTPRALILAPTRELAEQVNESVKTYSKYLSLITAVVYGGVKIGKQIQTLRRGVDILVATPGRLLDHLAQKTVDLSQVEILVLDECDRMLDMGFIRDIRKILAIIPHHRQSLLFSATFSPEIEKLAHTFLKSPILIEVASRNTAAAQVEQVVHLVDRHRKRELLSYMIGFHNWKQVLVFTRTKHGADRLTEQLSKDGLKSIAIHGNKSQAARTRALKDFKEGRVRVLVATDVASRGLDIDQLPHVVNFELPQVPEDYVHRIGRTGRAGNDGRAVSLVCSEEYPLLKSIEELLNYPLSQDVIAGYEPTSGANSGVESTPRQRSNQRRGNGEKSQTPSPPTRSKKSNSAKPRPRKPLRSA